MATRRILSEQDADDEERLVTVEVEEESAFTQPVLLPVWRKICFAVGGAPYQTTNTVINFFISIFLLEVAEISPSYISIILFAGKAWDAITDPTCGYFVNRCNTRFGKFRPWILFSAPLACGAYFCLWYVPDLSEVGKFGWYFVFYCSFQMLLSGLHVPYTSMTMAITTSQKDRDSITAYRMVSEACGVLVAVLVQGQLVAKYRKSGDCGEGKELSPEDIDNEKRSYIDGALVVIVAYLICACTVFFGSKEIPGVTTSQTEGFFSGAKHVLTFRPYVLLSTSFMFLSLAIAIVQGNLALFVTHTLKMGDQFSFFILVLLLSAIIAMPFWQMCVVRFGKKTTFATGMAIFLPVLIANLYVPDKDTVGMYYFYPLLVMAGLTISVALLLPWSMLPDVIDEYVIKYGSRKEAIFYSFYVFFSKLSVGVGLGISQVVLELGGYQTGECEQPESVALALQMLIVPGPVVFVLIALIALWAYPVNESRRKELKHEIAEWRRQQYNEANREAEQKTSPHLSVSYRSITGSTTTSATGV